MPAVIFDMDGVLVASGSAHDASWRAVARRHGIQISAADFKAAFGRTSRDIVRLWWGEGLSDEQVRAIDDEKELIYRELITGMVPLTIGLRETLARLGEAGIPLAVATSGPRENAELVLRESRLASAFRVVVTGADVSRGKPAPDCFLLAAERLRAAPADCVVVEDAPVGIEAALAAGMRVIGFTGTHETERLTACGAHAIAERMSDISANLVQRLVAASS